MRAISASISSSVNFAACSNKTKKRGLKHNFHFSVYLIQCQYRTFLSLARARSLSLARTHARTHTRTHSRIRTRTHGEDRHVNGKYTHEYMLVDICWWQHILMCAYVVESHSYVNHIFYVCIFVGSIYYLFYLCVLLLCAYVCIRGRITLGSGACGAGGRDGEGYVCTQERDPFVLLLLHLLLLEPPLPPPPASSPSTGVP